jgi:hypothetical protein
VERAGHSSPGRISRVGGVHALHSWLFCTSSMASSAAGRHGPWSIAPASRPDERRPGPLRG